MLRELGDDVVNVSAHGGQGLEEYVGTLCGGEGNDRGGGSYIPCV